MCSSYEEGKIQPEKSRTLDQKTCMKCKVNEAQVVIRNNDPFCHECFIQFCTHKFRSAFGKSKLVRDGEKVLVGFSGGSSCTSMLHLIREGKSVRAQKKLRFIPKFIHIDESCIPNSGGGDEAPHRLEAIEAVLRQSGYEHMIVKLTEVFDGLEVDGTSSQEKLSKLFSSTKTVTAQESLLRTLRCNLLARIARDDGIDKVLTGETATRLAVTMLAAVSQGKGAHIPYDTGFSDDRNGSPLFIRPMRDFTSKEVAFYNKLHHLTPIIIPTFSTMGHPSASIERLTENFVCGLQADFPSTINTILRTGDKLVSNPAVNNSDESSLYTNSLCALCKAPVDTCLPSSSAMGSIRYSEVLCKQRVAMLEQASSDDGYQNSVSSRPMESCCYSCQQTLADVELTKYVPSEATGITSAGSSLGPSIQEFLLT